MKRLLHRLLLMGAGGELVLLVPLQVSWQLRLL
jgi:hypothetical protein